MLKTKLFSRFFKARPRLLIGVTHVDKNLAAAKQAISDAAEKGARSVAFEIPFGEKMGFGFFSKLEEHASNLGLKTFLVDSPFGLKRVAAISTAFDLHKLGTKNLVQTRKNIEDDISKTRLALKKSDAFQALEAKNSFSKSLRIIPKN